jgi:hypothetical protein
MFDLLENIAAEFISVLLSLYFCVFISMRRKCLHLILKCCVWMNLRPFQKLFLFPTDYIVFPNILPYLS